METFKNIELKEALRAFRDDETPESINGLIQTLKTTQLLAPAQWDKDPVKDENGQMMFEPNTKFQLMVIQAENGDCFFPMFTDMDELQKWDQKQETQSLVMSFEQYLPFVQMSLKEIKGIVINPYGDNVPFDSDFLLGLATNETSELKENKVEEGTKVSLRDPIRNIDALKLAFAKLAMESPEIQAIYIKERLEKGKPSHWFVVVDMEPENPKLFQKLGEGVRAVNYGKDIEFMFGSAMLGQDVKRNTTPIYKKKAG